MIDCDFSPSQRELVYKYIIDKMGVDKSAYILTTGTIADKGTIDDIGGALSDIWKEGNDKIQELYKEMEEQLKEDENDEMPELAKWSTKNSYYRRMKEINDKENPYSLDKIAKIKEEYELNPEKTKLKYPDIFYYFDGLVGTVVSQGIHPAGMVASPITLPDNIGTFWRDGQRVLQINMEEIHDGTGLVKYDILGLKNIEIIKDTYEFLGKPYPRSYEIDWEDKDVWEHITDSPVGIFQFESKYASELLKRYHPKRINDLSLVNASLRPSGASYRDRLIDGEFNKNPSEIIDKLLEQNHGFLVFQEDTIAFLQNICGLSGSEADNIRRAIGRKQKDRLDKAMPSILEGYCSKSDKPREIAEQEAREFLQIIEDSSNYQFGYNHSTGYSMIGYLCGYLRYYHPVEFIASYLNNANTEDDIKSGTELANQLGVKISPPKFRYSKAKYVPYSKDRMIYKGIGSIKYLNEIVGDELYNLRDKEYNNFMELLVDLQDTSINSRQLDILIRLDFFEEFGGSKKLLEEVEIFNSLYSKKVLNLTKLPLGLTLDEIRPFVGKLTEKQGREVDIENLMNYCESKLKNEDLPLKDKFEAMLEYQGYISYKDESWNENVYVVTGIKTNKYGTTFVSIYNLKRGESLEIKVYKKTLSQNPLDEYDIIYAVIKDKNKKRKENGEWITLEETEKILESYRKVV